MGILLVHGAWHGAWCWGPVLADLESRRIEALAIDLPGHGARSATTDPIRLADYAAAVIEAGRSMSAPPVLVGHSMGGMVISAAAEGDPGAFKSLIYLAAFLPRTGEALATLAAQDGRVDGRLEGDKIVLESEEARRLFYQDCPSELVDWALSKIQPQPISPALDPLELTPERWGRLRRDYIVCSNDQAIRPEFQRSMAARANCESIIELECGHSPFLACPAELCSILARGAAPGQG